MAKYTSTFATDAYTKIAMLEEEKMHLKQQVKEYQDKIEQGTLIELPCKVGDILWVVDTAPYTMKVRLSTITKMCINILSDGRTDTTYFLRWHYNKSVYIENFYRESEFGNLLFFTREEAEKRLKEFQNGKNKS